MICRATDWASGRQDSKDPEPAETGEVEGSEFTVRLVWRR